MKCLASASPRPVELADELDHADLVIPRQHPDQDGVEPLILLVHGAALPKVD